MNNHDRFEQMSEESNENAKSGTNVVGTWILIALLISATGVAYAAAPLAS